MKEATQSASAEIGSETSRLFFEKTLAPQILVDPLSGRILDANPAACAFYGYSRNELTARSLTDINTLSAEQLAEARTNAIAEKRSYFRFEHRLASGEIREVEVQSGPIELEGRTLLLSTIHDVSGRRAFHDLLAMPSHAMGAAMDGMALLDRDERYVYANPAHAHAYGYERPEELLGMSWRALYAADERARIEADVMPAFRAVGHWRGEAVGLRKDGTTFPQEISLVTVEGGGLACVVRDITARRRSEALQSALLRIAEASSAIQDVSALYADIQRIVGELMNADNLYISLFDEATGTLEFPYFVDEMDKTAPLPRLVARGLTDYVLRTGTPLLANPSTLARLVASGEVEMMGAPSLDWVGVPLKRGEKTFGVLALQTYSERARYTERERDILTFVSSQVANAIDRKHADDRIRALAYHDALTGLPNRLLFNDRLALALAQARRKNERLAVLFLDLDGFKAINDSLGHNLGDRLLKGTAERIAGSLRAVDTVARLGGDEFILLLPGIRQAEEAARVAEKILEGFRSPLAIDGHELFVTASLGISLYPDDGEDVEALVKNADTAMYRAKEQGRDRYQLYTASMNSKAMERLALENSLRKALHRGELLVHYQPLLDLATGRIHGVEALLRWKNPDRDEIIPAADFIALAEVTGLIVPIGPFVLRTACAQARLWQQQGHPNLRVAVNLSARQLQQPDLVSQVRHAVEEAGLDPRTLDLEITESQVMQSAEALRETLPDLKALGVSITIDDFGVAAAALRQLRRLPIDALKIDRSFVRDLLSSPDDAAIARAVVNLAHTLRLRVVAKGVETEEQRSFLTAQGCDLIQGHLLSEPVSAEECTKVLARYQ